MKLQPTVPAGAAVQPSPNVNPTVFRILLAISLVHLFNDSIQSVIPAILPILKNSMQLSYVQTGFIFFMLNMTSSIMQPGIGYISDKRPSPYMLPLGMFFMFLGMLGIALSHTYWLILLSVILVGLGSAVFHPEGARVAFMAAGSRRGLAQSIFQVGGNSGQALASVMTALIFAPLGQMGAVWFTFVAAAAILVQLFIAKWYKGYLMAHPRQPKSKNAVPVSIKRKKQVAFTLSVLLLLIFARSWYGAGITAYYPFYIMDQFGFELKHAQMYIFLYGVTAAIGTFFGGPLADKFGRRNIIFFSILGTAPLALLLPYANEFWAYFILLLNGFILMSSTSVTVVYAQELLPGKVGTVSGLTNGFSFGLGALGAVALGGLADLYHMKFVMQLCSFLPLLGLAAILLPSDRKLKEWAATDE